MYVNEVGKAQEILQLQSSSTDSTNSAKGSVYGDGIVESNDLEFSKNPFNKYSAEDFDRFNTLLSGKNGAEAQESTDNATRNVNNAYNEFKNKYPEEKITLPEPPNPANYDKGTKGYHAYEKALIKWEIDCKTIIEEKSKMMESKQTQVENDKPTPANSEKHPVENKTLPPKTNHPSHPLEPVNNDRYMERMPLSPPPEESSDLNLEDMLKDVNSDKDRIEAEAHKRFINDLKNISFQKTGEKDSSYDPDPLFSIKPKKPFDDLGNVNP